MSYDVTHLTSCCWLKASLLWHICFAGWGNNTPPWLHMRRGYPAGRKGNASLACSKHACCQKRLMRVMILQQKAKVQLCGFVGYQTYLWLVHASFINIDHSIVLSQGARTLCGAGCVPKQNPRHEGMVLLLACCKLYPKSRGL